MANLGLLQGRYAVGMMRDVPRHQLPPDAVYNLVNFIPDLRGAPLTGRGSWTYYNSSGALPSQGKSALYWRKSNGNEELISQAGSTVYRIPTVGSVVSIGSVSSSNPYQNPVPYGSKVLIPNAGGAPPVAHVYDGTSITAVTGFSAKAPLAVFATIYKDRAWLAEITSDLRVYASAAGDIGSYDETYRFFGLNALPTGMASLRNAMLIFHKDRTTRVRGDTPPSATSTGNLIRESFLDVGCLDARSIANYSDYCIFASKQGVFLTDGSFGDDLTLRGGISEYYRGLAAQVEGFGSSLSAAVGWVMRGHYFLVLTNSSGAILDCLVCNLGTKRWFRFANVYPASVSVYNDEAYGIMRTLHKAVKFSNFFSNFGGTDPDGIEIDPVLETGFFRDKPGLKRWNSVYLGFTSSATIEVFRVLMHAPNTYVSLGTFGISNFDTNYVYTRDRLPIGEVAEGIAFKVATGISPTTYELYDLGVHMHTLSQSRITGAT